MTEYKVGDKVKILDNAELYGNEKHGDIVEIQCVWNDGRGITTTDKYYYINCEIELVEETKPNIKVGDKVIVLSDNTTENVYNFKKRQEFIGKTSMITVIAIDVDEDILYILDNGLHYWENELKLVEDEYKFKFNIGDEVKTLTGYIFIITSRFKSDKLCYYRGNNNVSYYEDLLRLVKEHDNDKSILVTKPWEMKTNRIIISSTPKGQEVLFNINKTNEVDKMENEMELKDMKKENLKEAKRQYEEERANEETKIAKDRLSGIMDRVNDIDRYMKSYTEEKAELQKELDLFNKK